MKSRYILPNRLLLFGIVIIAFCLSSCKHTNGPSGHAPDYLNFQVVKFTNADYAQKILATPYVERTLVRRDGALAYYDAKLDSFELNPVCTEYTCDSFFDVGNQPYIDMGNGYLLVRWPWSRLVSRYNFHIPVLLDIDWEDLKSPYQRWAIDDVTVLAEAPFAEYYGFTSKTIDEIYNTKLQDILQAGTCQAWKDGKLYYDFKNGWDGDIVCGVREYPELCDHLLNVRHQYEQMIIELFQSGEYKETLKEQSKDVHYTSLEELKKNPI